MPRSRPLRASAMLSHGFAQIVLALLARDALQQPVGLARLRGLAVGPVADHLLLGAHVADEAVDGLGEIHSFEQVGESWKLVVDAPRDLGKYLAYKGSVVVNGVSLTVNSVEDIDAAGSQCCRFSINLIPHTIAVTTLKHLRAGAKVNLEIDLIARYVERMLSASNAAK